MAPLHQPVMLPEVLEYLRPGPGRTILDFTVGSGGHAAGVAARGAFVIGLDRDPRSLEIAGERLAAAGAEHRLIHGRASEAEQLLTHHHIRSVDGCLFDSGISMDQMLAQERGFSAHSTSSMDMRFDPSHSEKTAADVVNEYLENDLAQVFARITGRGREARHVAHRIVASRRTAAIRDTATLAELIAATVARDRRVRRIDAAPFLLALRVEVNDELNELRAAMEVACRLLSPTGRLVTLTWFSAEHGIARRSLRRLAAPCTCPPTLPCVCRQRPLVTILTPKPLYPSDQEVMANPAARSARLMAAERTETGQELQDVRDET